MLFILSFYVAHLAYWYFLHGIVIWLIFLIVASFWKHIWFVWYLIKSNVCVNGVDLKKYLSSFFHISKNSSAKFISDHILNWVEIIYLNTKYCNILLQNQFANTIMFQCQIKMTIELIESYFFLQSTFVSTSTAC